MRHRWRARLVLLPLLLLVAAAGAPARAQVEEDIPETDAPASPPEQAALDALREGRFVRGRELAEAILRANPGSVPAEYVLGIALHEAEGNTPLALRHFQRALARVSLPDGHPLPGRSGWHARLLVATMAALSDLGRNEELLAAQRLFRATYSPQAHARDVWPLMKLGRVDAARSAAQRALVTGDPIEEAIARNGLCALDGYPACAAMLESVRRAKLDPGLALRNLGVSALEAGRFAEAERLLQESTQHPDESANPWRDLTALYVGQARFGEALEASRRMIAFSRALPPRFRQHGGAEDLVTAGQMLLLAGHPERAAAATARALAAPDRASHWSGSSQEILAEGQLLDRAIHLTLAEAEREAAALSSWAAAPAHWTRAAAHAVAGWLSGRRVQPLLQHGGLRSEDPAQPLRPELSAPGWLLPDVVALFGAGPTIALIGSERARTPAENDPVPSDLREGMALAVESEARWLRGDRRGCLAAGRRARELLPAAEVLLRARLALRMAQSAYAAGDLATAGPLYDEVLARDPGALRRLGVALPVRVAGGGPAGGGSASGGSASGGSAGGGGSADAAAAAFRAAGTPRFRRDDASPFVLAPQGRQLCLSGPQGAVLACAADPGPRPAGEKKPQQPEQRQEQADVAYDPRDLPDAPARIAGALLRVAFAPRVDLSQQDLSTLDGTPIAERGLDASRLDNLLR